MDFNAIDKIPDLLNQQIEQLKMMNRQMRDDRPDNKLPIDNLDNLQRDAPDGDAWETRCICVNGAPNTVYRLQTTPPNCVDFISDLIISGCVLIGSIYVATNTLAASGNKFNNTVLGDNSYPDFGINTYNWIITNPMIYHLKLAKNSLRLTNARALYAVSSGNSHTLTLNIGYKRIAIK